MWRIPKCCASWAMAAMLWPLSAAACQQNSASENEWARSPHVQGKQRRRRADEGLHFGRVGEHALESLRPWGPPVGDAFRLLNGIGALLWAL